MTTQAEAGSSTDRSPVYIMHISTHFIKFIIVGIIAQKMRSPTTSSVVEMVFGNPRLKAFLPNQ